MPRFHCKHCGIVSDDAEIVPLPKEDAWYRQLQVQYDGFWQKVGDAEYGMFTINAYDRLFAQIRLKYNHSITCSVCLGETTFWRESPFPLAPLPTDGRINLDGSPFSLKVRDMIAEAGL